MAPYGRGTLSHPKVCPCLSEQMRTGRGEGSYCNEGRLCARARTTNRSSWAPCYRNQPRPNVPDNPIILVAANSRVSSGSKLPTRQVLARPTILHCLPNWQQLPLQGPTKRRFPGCFGTVSCFCCPGISGTEQASAVLNSEYHLH